MSEFQHYESGGNLPVALDIGGGSVDTVHNESSTVHTALGGRNEVGNGGTSGPCGVNKGIRVMENGFEVFPFTGVAVETLVKASCIQ